MIIFTHFSKCACHCSSRNNKSTNRCLKEVKTRRNPVGLRTYHLKGSLEVKKSVEIIKKNKEIVAMDEKKKSEEKEIRSRCVIFSYFRTEMRKTHFHSFVFSSPGYNYFNKKNVKHFFVYKTQYNKY